MGLVTYFNEAASDLWGRRPELHAEKWSGSYRVYNLEGALVTPEERPIARTITLRKLVEPKVAVVQRPDQSLALVCSNPTPLFDRSGNFIGALNFLADVSKTSSNEERLREIQRLAEIGRGILAVSNEINNILSVFANLASVIKRGDPVFASQAAEIAEEMVPRAARLISDLRAFATKRYFVQP
jgi:PAS domain-containing protein